MLILAQVPAATGAEIATWLISAAAVLLIMERGFSFWKNHLREEPTPSQTYATRTALSELDARVKENEAYSRARRGEIYKEFSKIREEANEMAAEIYSTLKPVSEAVASIREKAESNAQRIGVAESDIKVLYRRTP
jgi:hypothetical protein